MVLRVKHVVFSRKVVGNLCPLAKLTTLIAR